MFESWMSMSGAHQFVLLLVTVVMTTSMLVPIVSVVSCQWRKVREREAATALVHDMLARGLSTEEMERILAGAGIAKGSRNSALDEA